MKLFFKLLIMIGVFALCQATCKKTTTCIGKPLENCMCTMEYAPVCGCDGKQYSNACVAKCAGVKTWTKGECGN